MSNPFPPAGDPSELVFEPSKAQSAYQKMEPRLLAMPDASLRHPNNDLGKVSARVLLVALDVKRHGLRPHFAALPAEHWSVAHLDELEDLAWAAWHAHEQRLVQRQQHSAAKLPVGLLQEARALRAEMLAVLGYRFHGTPSVQQELQNIRQGAGYLDLSRDLSRLAALYKEHAFTLGSDTHRYRAADTDRATRLAGEIIEQQSPAPNAWEDRALRAASALLQSYEEVVRAADFLYAHAPQRRDLFPGLAPAAGLV
jgi:hypothetical protein